MTDINLVEHAAPLSVPLPAPIGRALASARILDAVPDPYRSEHWRLVSRGKVGVVAVNAPGHPTHTIRIAPKVSVGRLLFLLGYACNPKGWQRADEVTVEASDDLLVAIARAFERQAEKALRLGLLQGYRYTEESGFVVRGRIREADQLRRRFGAVLPVEIAYEDFTTDVPENRLVRGAAEKLLWLPGLPADVRRRLLHLRARLVDVASLPPRAALPRWHATRLNSRYHSALRLAELILRDASTDHRAGDVQVHGFLFDMHSVFEDFVAVALAEAWAGTAGLHCGRTDPHHLDEENRIRMLPDVVVYGPEGVPLAVADAKYKVGGRGGYPDADLYQMLAYCTALDLGDGHLIYAKGSAPHDVHRVRNAGVRIHQHSLDLDQSPGPLLRRMAELARLLVPATTTGPPSSST